MWFNNIVIYQLVTPIEANHEQQLELLEEHGLKPCPPHARQSQGWVSPIPELEEKVYDMHGCQIMVAATESRLLPASITRAVLEEKMNAFELTHQKPMRRAERLQLKEDIEFDLLPKAFTVQKKEYFYIDTVKNWIIINTANLNKASEIMVRLTKTLGSFTAAPLTTDTNLNDLFASWLRDPQLMPEGLVLQQHCTLINGNGDKSRYHCKNIEQSKQEILVLLEQGYTVASVELAWLDRIQFILTDNFLLKRLKCMDYLDDALKDNNQLESKQEKFDANFTLLAGEVRALLTFLIKHFKVAAVDVANVGTKEPREELA
ncbi:MAG: recombination-associated protein RdgC [Gammaproteobacteria bacterium]|nr:recombination-associated protein RdgC [Gammaproteobacteria bacterium]